jgi:cytochrome c
VLKAADGYGGANSLVWAVPVVVMGPAFEHGGALRGSVIDRKAGTGADYDHSPTVKVFTIAWSPDTLDRWLTDPEKVIPGRKMGNLVPLEQVRSDIITCLAKVSARP